jgi:hypothetical protein
MVARRLLPLVALVLLAACSGGGDGDGDDDGASLGVTAAPTEVTAPGVPAASPPGTGVVVVGGASSSFAVTECRLEPGEAAGTSFLLRVAGKGTTGGGVPFEIEVKRFATATSVETFTDTISYSDTARILQVQRFEVAGEVTDLRDPDARGTLVRVRPDGVSAAGVAGPPGAVAGEDEGIVGLALDATCDP